MVAARVARHDHVVEKRDGEDLGGAHDVGRGREVLIARRRISGRMIVPQYEGARACSERRTQDDSEVDGPDEMLASNSGDMAAPVMRLCPRLTKRLAWCSRSVWALRAWRARAALGASAMHSSAWRRGRRDFTWRTSLTGDGGVSERAWGGLDGFHGGSGLFRESRGRCGSFRLGRATGSSRRWGPAWTEGSGPRGKPSKQRACHPEGAQIVGGRDVFPVVPGERAAPTAARSEADSRPWMR